MFVGGQQATCMALVLRCARRKPPEVPVLGVEPMAVSLGFDGFLKKKSDPWKEWGR